MFRYGLLVLSPSCIRTKIPSLLKQASQEVKEVLYVDIYQPDSLHVGSLYDLLVDLYSKNSARIGHLDVRFLLPSALAKTESSSDEVRHLLKKPEVAFVRDIFCQEGKPSSQVGLFEFKKWMTRRFQVSDLQEKLKYLKVEDERTDNNIINGVCLPDCSQSNSLQTYKEVVLGGTFDHIHSGHRLLLSVASLLCDQKLSIGLSDGPLLQRKILKELIDPFQERKKKLQEFLDDVKPGLEYDIIQLLDPVGPAGADPDYRCLVVSKETEKGGLVVNGVREKKGLDPLDVHIVDVVEDKGLEFVHGKQHDGEEKMSSTAERQKLLGTLLRPVVRKDKIHNQPYVIGLTGGIASGKSAVCQRLKGLGAAVISCDQLGHQAYAPGKKAYKEIIESFGSGILTPEQTINRRALGSIVFADKAKLALLNQIVWPEILTQANTEIAQYAEEGFKVCVLDAAVLLEAGWDKETDEVWVTFVPESEALSRILSRDGISEQQAANRIKSQISNEETVSQANVVICTLWDPEFTQEQVVKAWINLQERI